MKTLDLLWPLIGWGNVALAVLADDPTGNLLAAIVCFATAEILDAIKGSR
jgi:hypothetical protein